jgi:hypothetical protein
LILINYINAHPGGDGTIPLSNDPAQTGYIDVFADGKCVAIDVLEIINYINANPQREAESDTLVSAAPTTNDSSSSEGRAVAAGSQSEGEYTVDTPTAPADYYAHTPAIGQTIRGADKPCNCAACRSARGEAVAQLVQPEVPLAPSPTASAVGSENLDTTLDLIVADVSRFKASRSA